MSRPLSVLGVLVLEVLDVRLEVRRVLSEVLRRGLRGARPGVRDSGGGGVGRFFCGIRRDRDAMVQVFVTVEHNIITSA